MNSKNIKNLKLKFQKRRKITFLKNRRNLLTLRYNVTFKLQTKVTRFALKITISDQEMNHFSVCIYKLDFSFISHSWARSKNVYHITNIIIIICKLTFILNFRQFKKKLFFLTYRSFGTLRKRINKKFEKIQ